MNGRSRIGWTRTGRRKRAAEVKRIRLKHIQQQQKVTDLRRTVSMNNLHKATHDDPDELAGDNASKIDASGIESFAPSGYLAASGYSVGITSTYGTTSTVGSSTLHATGSLAHLGDELLASGSKLPKHAPQDEFTEYFDYSYFKDEETPDRTAHSSTSTGASPDSNTAENVGEGESERATCNRSVHSNGVERRENTSSLSLTVTLYAQGTMPYIE